MIRTSSKICENVKQRDEPNLSEGFVYYRTRIFLMLTIIKQMFQSERTFSEMRELFNCESALAYPVIVHHKNECAPHHSCT